LAVGILLLGVADSMVGSYLVLFTADVAGLNPVQVWSLAWAIGPLIGTAVLTRTGFTTILWTAAGVLACTSLLVALTVPALQQAGERRNDGRHDAHASAAAPAALTMVLLTSSITLFFIAMFAGSVALPLYVTRGLHEAATPVGVLFSVCAAVEVVAALALAALPTQFSW